MTKVKVLLNSSRGNFFGYEPGASLHLAIEYETDSKDPLDEAFEAFNAPPEYLSPRLYSLNETYRDGSNRSLSVGDVLILDDDVAYTVENVGFNVLDALPEVDPRPWYDAIRERPVAPRPVSI